MNSELGRSVRLLDDAMLRVNAWRTPFRGPTAREDRSKEWMHFALGLPGGGQLLVNLSVTTSQVDHQARRQTRLITLAWDGAWNGRVQSFEDDRVVGESGRLDLTIGDSRLAWQSGAYHLRLRTEEISSNLILRPATLPTLASSVSLDASNVLRWVVVPRLFAEGWLRVGDRSQHLQRALAYHDHNWGRFRWGGELAWEWGYFHPRDPGCPWDVVVARVCDGLGHRSISQTVLVWRNNRLLRVFESQETAFSAHGVRVAERPFSIPAIAALLAPGSSSGVPARFCVEAQGLSDESKLEFEPTECARVVLPSEAQPLKLVLLNETRGPARVSGRVAGESFTFESDAMMEFVRG